MQAAPEGDLYYDPHAEKGLPQPVPRHRSWLAAHKKLAFFLGGLGVIAVLAVALGAGLGVGLKGKKSKGNNSTSSSLDSSGNDPKEITPRPAWNWNDKMSKAIGVALGNWLVLERWMDEDWFTKYSNPDDWDEWSLVQTLGDDKAYQVLDNHFDSFVSEDQVQKLSKHAINQVSIPIGFWVFGPTVHSEPYVNSTQLHYLTRMLGWLWKRQMYAVIVLQGMPGSQSGQPSTGQNTSNPTWWTHENQDRSDKTLASLLDWLSYNPYKSVVSAIMPVHAPGGNKDPDSGTHMPIVQSFYDRSYKTLSQAGYPMMMHDANMTNPWDYWHNFTVGKDPSKLIITGDYFPGNGLIHANRNDYTNTLCHDLTKFSNYSVPMVKTYSMVTHDEVDQSFIQVWHDLQLKTCARAGSGAFFWSFQTKASTTPVQALDARQQWQYSFVHQMDAGTITPMGYRGSNTTLTYLHQQLNYLNCDGLPSLPYDYKV